MRSFCGVVLAVALISSNAFAASDSNAPLPAAGASASAAPDSSANSAPLAPGKPSGVDQAKLSRGTGTLLLLGGGGLLAGVLLLSSGTFGGGQPFTTTPQ